MMRRNKIIAMMCLLFLTVSGSLYAQRKVVKTYIPWNNGKLIVDEKGPLT